MRPFLILCVAAWLTGGMVAQQQSPFFQPSVVQGGVPGGNVRGALGQGPVGPLTCAADGVVVSATTGEPVLRAHVTVSGLGAGNSVATDAQGRWSLQGLPCGRTQISAQKAGFNNSFYGQTRPGISVKPLLLVDGSPAHDLKVLLMPQSVVTGKVIDENGDPVQNVQIQVITSMVQEGKRQWQPRNNSQTNDLGEYRIHGLSAGKYIVCAHGNPMMMAGVVSGAMKGMVYNESCFPGPPEGATAGTLDFLPGRENRVDFTLAPVKGVTLRGTVTGAGNERGIGLQLRKRQVSFGNMQGSNTRVLEDGRFEITGVLPGSYFLSANVFRPNSRLSGEVPVDVGNADLDGVNVAVSGGFPITGTVTIEGKPDTTPPNGIRPSLPNGIPLNFSLRPAENMMMMGMGQVKWGDDKKSFTMTDAMPGKYRAEVYPMGAYFVKSIKMGDQDVTNEDITLQQTAAFEIVLSNEGGVVSGNLLGDDGKPASGQVILISTSRKPIMSFANQDGKYTFGNVPPGSYKLYAWSDPQQAEYANPDWMRQFGADGVAVTVAAGQTANADAKQTVLP